MRAVSHSAFRPRDSRKKKQRGRGASSGLFGSVRPCSGFASCLAAAYALSDPGPSARRMILARNASAAASTSSRPSGSLSSIAAKVGALPQPLSARSRDASRVDRPDPPVDLRAEYASDQPHVSYLPGNCVVTLNVRVCPHCRPRRSHAKPARRSRSWVSRTESTTSARRSKVTSSEVVAADPTSARLKADCSKRPCR